MLTGVYGLNIPDSTIPCFYFSLTWDQALFSFRFENYIPAANFSGSRERECMRTAQIGPDLRLIPPKLSPMGMLKSDFYTTFNWTCIISHLPAFYSYKKTEMYNMNVILDK